MRSEERSLAKAALPFNNLGDEKEQEYLADGITEDIITALTRFRWFFVIARNSSFFYKGKSLDVKQIAQDLGVRYLLEGSVRKASGRVRISAQLIDARSGNHLWAERMLNTAVPDNSSLAPRRASRALSSRRAGARDKAQLEVAADDETLQPSASALGEIALPVAGGQQSCLRRVEADQADRAAARPDRIAVDDRDIARVDRRVGGGANDLLLRCRVGGAPDNLWQRRPLACQGAAPVWAR
jgi:TolB-like protein